ncbi:putative Diguanylate phosphodiesterase [Candidatus Competibacter denitrificans Run_A_D11]|uniref:Diguanylate phosphodiesterase n=1 Tax=Candidatus Competibacter denitrificans Run_A_D11 TaxID=1400863 RepID=W6M0Z8_9GAMM|nr:HDOD domain-containing protein [Candidatus Competibacter denitrificans]CDI01062.1 putative Diguanylate phosphodiesterase [Candidatus Competibacter denitrificans Run_A_D11]HAS86285.1 EAL domain-containing protein [Candidatus Competibacteraceae bacterium]HRC68980.1 HDOD domain-containing protein [Candidatus Competibacter denitrificans]
MTEIYFARQPIYNRDLEIAGYELFYRQAADADSADFLDAEIATSQVVLNTVGELGLEQVVGSHKAFINVARDFVVSGYLEMFASPQLVFEVAGSLVVDQQLLEVLQQLHERGYRFVLDDYRDDEANQALLTIVDYVKIDMLVTPQDEVQRMVELLRQRSIVLMAERIETQEVQEFCQALGFDYFQGYHFSQPKVLKFHGVRANQLSVLQLVSKLYQPDIDLEAIEALIRQDVSLSYKLLRYINSAYFNLPHRIDSIQRAIVLLGTRNVRAWATLVSLANIDNHRSDLITIALERAKMCELLAAAMGIKQKESGYTVGLLSVLDAMTQAPMANVLATLPLDEDINEALLRHEGPLGRILACTLAYERCDWEGLDTLGLEMNQINDAYMTALAEAYRISCELLKS